MYREKNQKQTQQDFIVSQLWRLSAGLAPAWGHRGGFSSSLHRQRLAVTISPWCSLDYRAALQSLLLWSPGCPPPSSVVSRGFSSSVCACPCVSSYKDVGHSGLRAHLTPPWLHLNLHVERLYFPLRSLPPLLGVRTSTYLLGGTELNPPGE